MNKSVKASGSEAITVRRPDFALNGNFTQHWFANNPILTHILNAMHTVFPVGERQFIKTVKVYESLIKDGKLRAEVKAFIGQETQHGKQHDIFLQTLDRMGLDATGYADWYGKAAFSLYDDKHSAEAFWTSILRPFFSAGADDRIMLAFTAALEHLTATLAEVILKDDLIFDGMPENMKELFWWHAVEEIEHKAVAFDVFTDVAKGNYAERMTGFVFAMYYLNYFIARGFLHFVARDKSIEVTELPGAIVDAFPRAWRLVSGVAKGLLPYAKPDFHPNDVGQHALAKATLDRLMLSEKLSA